MFDVFYFGPKPNLFEFEKPATDLDDAAAQSRTGSYWYIYGGNDYSNFDFDWRPAPWESTHVHVFPSQHQRNGEVYFANPTTVHNREWNFRQESTVTRLAERDRWIVPQGVNDSMFDYSWHPDRTEPDYEYRFGTQWQKEGGPIYPGQAGVKYMHDQRIKAGATQIFYMDFMNSTFNRFQFDLLRVDHPSIKKTRYVDNHLNVFKRIMNLATTEFVWIISSICDYNQFDFTWHPPEEQREMIHCFPTGYEKRGDTFYIHVPSFKQQMIDLELLDWFNVINYCKDQTVERFDTPVHVYDSDNLVDVIKNYEFKTPYALFTNQPDTRFTESTCLWSKKDRTVQRCSVSGATCLVPRDIKEYLDTQIYDYPYLEDSVLRINEYDRRSKNPWMDIVFISNGEPLEQKHFEHLVYTSNNYDVKWIRGVNGRTKAIRAAAEASTTPWFFCVPAKLAVDTKFDWYWMPDYYQGPKHYVFTAHNPVNGLEYGHQAMVCYNRNLVLNTTDPGIDFTLSQAHEVVPISSGVAEFNSDPWTTWRTAFREVVKLRHYMAVDPTLETEHRLHIWCTVARGPNAEWSLRGSKDATEYYNAVGGNYDEIMKTYSWAWLQDHFKRCCQ